jgi:autotransporter-associated beta strand protein
MKTPSRSRLASALLLALATALPLAAQSTYDWDGGSAGGNTNWTSTGNWSPELGSTSDLNGSNLVFATRNGSGNLPASFLTGADYTIRSITFDNTAGLFSSGTHNIQNSTAATGSTNRVLTFNTAGIDIITTANFASATTIRFRAFGVTSESVDSTFNLVLDYVGRSAVNAGANTTVQIESVVSGAGGLVKTGGGTLYLNPTAANTYSGGTVIESGVLQAGRTGSLGAGAVQLGVSGGGSASLISQRAGWTYSNDITVASGAIGTLVIGTGVDTGNFNSTFTGDIAVNNALTILAQSSTGYDLRFNGALSGDGDITKTGAGLWRVSNANNTWTGNLDIQTGGFELANTGRLNFVLGDSGATNSITGAGSADFSGVFVIDDSAITTDGSWQLVDLTNLDAAFGASFTLRLLTETETFADLGEGVYQFENWTFSSLTGVLTTSSTVPEPSTFAALAGLGAIGLVAMRRRSRA